MTSLKKLIAVLAVSLPLAVSAQQAAPPAAAAAPLYQIYGTLNANFQYFEASDPTNKAQQNNKGRFGVSIDSSNIGIRGTADTGQFGLGVVYQCETAAVIDGDPTAALCGRNSRLGLTHAYGTLFYGNWDTPYKASAYGTKADDPFGNTDVFDLAAIIGSPGLNTRSSAGNSAGANAAAGTFNVRAANSVAYHSPKYEGFQVKAQYSANERRFDSGATANDDLAPQLWSVSANYDRGPFSIFAAYERHDDWNGVGQGTGKTTVDTGLKLGAGYELASGAGTTTIGAQFEMLNYTVDKPNAAAGSFDSASRNAFMVGVKHRMGDHEFRLRYSQALEGDVTVTGPAPAVNPGDKTGAVNYAIGYAYHLSKATQLYAFFTYLDNEDNAQYTFATAGPTAGATSQVTVNPGANPAAGGIGMRYAF